MKLVPKGPISNKSSSVHVMACHCIDHNPLPEPMIQFSYAYALGLKMLTVYVLSQVRQEPTHTT